MNIDLQEYSSLVKEAAGCQLLSYEDMTSTGGDTDESSAAHTQVPSQELQEQDFRSGHADNAGLPKRERLIMALYYDEECKLREIGEILGVSEGRVC